MPERDKNLPCEEVKVWRDGTETYCFAFAICSPDLCAVEMAHNPSVSHCLFQLRERCAGGIQKFKISSITITKDF